VARILAVDWGEKRLGLAVSDPLGLIARALPTATLPSPGAAPAAVLEAARAHEVERIVIGLPLDMDGTVGEAARKALALAEAVGAGGNLPVETWDERLTSTLAGQYLREEGFKATSRRGGGRERARPVRGAKGRVDARAAVLLLQSWLDARRFRDEAGT